ncbi:hypothetical protein Glove_555g8 [Diversispora epigaea]|uniref:Nudix hydrolase domain-containing protein n=1 Tax=Diversispora epigaea TaxID=1348612 RepID=A0A397GFL3_9GLOM|nr:hypothetical protein Glove_555g8 [Diversispora epigaea]
MAERTPTPLEERVINNEQAEKEIKQILGVPIIEEPEETRIAEDTLQAWEQIQQQELSEERNRIEILTQEVGKCQPVEPIIWKKETSVFHCENCKENEENYEYCVPSTILCYKALYNNERIVKEEKEKELKEYDDLFKIYQKQEEEKQDEIIIKDQSTFEEILAEFDKIIDLELVINPEIYSTIRKQRKYRLVKEQNSDKEFYEHWQSPGGHIEESDISAKWAARREVFEEILAEFDKIIDLELVINPEIYSTIRKQRKYRLVKEQNSDKEFYEHWQSPGGHIEESDISAKWAARREVFEETGIYLKLEELNYWRTQHYYKEDQWRIVHCYKAEIKGIPNLTEPQEMTHWELKKSKEILKGPMIDSLKDIIRYPKENETKIIIIEGSCGAGKSTLTKKCKEYYKKQGLLTTLIDESFITQDPEQKLKKYAENLERYRKNEITKEQMEILAVEWEKEIRDKWMSQIYFQVTNNLTGIKPDVIIMDRNLWSTIIFMKNMIKEGFFTEESLKKITENYEYWKFFTREALVIWWNTPTEEIIKRLIKRNRRGEGDLEYFRNLIKTYKEYMPEVYQNIKIINRETLVTIEELDELLPEILNEKRIRN